MSVLGEPSELTPLRRSNLRQQQSQSTNHSEQQQLTLSSQPPTQAPVSRPQNQSANFCEYVTINNNNTIIQSGDSSDTTNSDLNTIDGRNMSETSRILTRITIDFAVLLTGESFLTNFSTGNPNRKKRETFFRCDCFRLKTKIILDWAAPFISNDFKASMPWNENILKT